MKEATLTKKDVKNVKKAVERAEKAKAELSEEDTRKFKELMEATKNPIEFTDDDFRMGERELDVRNLSEANYKQLMFRLEVVKCNHLRDIAQTQGDILRFEMMILEKMGVTDIVEEYGKFIDKLNEKR